MIPSLCLLSSTPIPLLTFNNILVNNDKAVFLTNEMDPVSRNGTVDLLERILTKSKVTATLLHMAYPSI